ncbi:MAG: hypothetical protein OXI43_18000 [Candidatus Poribacteria bacterium]|nr:hypothetical protein [Candidatus Poribacteria bacterium]
MRNLTDYATEEDKRARHLTRTCQNRGKREEHRKRGLVTLELPNAYSKFAPIV